MIDLIAQRSLDRVRPTGDARLSRGKIHETELFDNVGCPTPHSFDNALALILDGPIIFATIFSLNFSLCFTASSAFSPPGFSAQLRRQLP